MTDKIKNRAIHILSRRDHGVTELITKLIQKGFERDNILPVIEELIAAGYLDDARFTASYIRYRKQRGYGPERIGQELSGKGIPDSIIADHLILNDNDWPNMARQVRLKHFKNQPITDFKVKAKQMRFLQYRGFTHEQIRHAFKDLADNLQDNEG